MRLFFVQKCREIKYGMRNEWSRKISLLEFFHNKLQLMAIVNGILLGSCIFNSTHLNV